MYLRLCSPKWCPKHDYCCTQLNAVMEHLSSIQMRHKKKKNYGPLKLKLIFLWLNEVVIGCIKCYGAVWLCCSG